VQLDYPSAKLNIKHLNKIKKTLQLARSFCFAGTKFKNAVTCFLTSGGAICTMLVGARSNSCVTKQILQ